MHQPVTVSQNGLGRAVAVLMQTVTGGMNDWMWLVSHVVVWGARRKRERRKFREFAQKDCTERIGGQTPSLKTPFSHCVFGGSQLGTQLVDSFRFVSHSTDNQTICVELN